MRFWNCSWLVRLLLVAMVASAANCLYAQAPLTGCKGDACDILQTQHTDHGIRVRNTSDRTVRVVLHTCPDGKAEEFSLRPHARLGTRFMEICGGYEVYYAEVKSHSTS